MGAPIRTALAGAALGLWAAVSARVLTAFLPPLVGAVAGQAMAFGESAPALPLLLEPRAALALAVTGLGAGLVTYAGLLATTRRWSADPRRLFPWYRASVEERLDRLDAYLNELAKGEHS